MHADLVRPGGLRLNRVGVDVLEELEATVAVWRLEHRDVGVVAVEADGGVGHSPLTVSRPRTVSPRSVKKAIAASRSRTAMPTFSSLMRMRCTLPSQGDVCRSVSCQFRLSRTRNCPAAVPREDLLRAPDNSVSGPDSRSTQWPRCASSGPTPCRAGQARETA